MKDNIIRLKRGETVSKKVILKKAGEFEDLTSYEILFTVKKTLEDLDRNDKSAVIKKTLNKLPETGQARIDLTEDDTFQPSGEYKFDIKYRKDEGAWVRNIVGDFIITGVATNR